MTHSGVEGTILDQTGAAIPGAQVTVRNEGAHVSGMFGKVGWTHTFSPSLLNEASMTLVRVDGQTSNTSQPELPSISVPSLAAYSSSPLLFLQPNYNWQDHLSWIHANRNLKFGVDVDRQHDLDNFTPEYTHPTFTFSNLLDFAQDLPLTQSGPVIDTRTGALAQNVYTKVHMTCFGAFTQDDWKIRRNLTLNLGLRYEYYGHLAQIGSKSHNRRERPGCRFRVHPFGSIALDVRNGQTPNFALRSANGLYFPPPPGLQIQLNPAGGLAGTPVSVKGLSPSIDSPRVQVWNLTVEKRLTNSIIVEADYLGNHGSDLFLQTNVNRYVGDLLQHNGTLTRLNPNFSTITYGRSIGYSDGEFATFLISKRFPKEFSLRGIYTCGKATDLTSSNDNGVANAENVLDAANPQAQHGLADFNTSKKLTIDGIYEVPSPFKQGLANKILGGWELAGISIFQSGLPFSVYTSAAYPKGDYNGDGFNWDFPNTPAFGNHVVPASGQQGNLGRIEGATFQLRDEMFNLLNRGNLTNPVSDTSNSLFGKSTGQNLSPVGYIRSQDPTLMRQLPLAILFLASSLLAQTQSTTDRYLSSIAKQAWTERNATIASIHTPAEVEQRQRFIRAKLLELLGGFPERTPLHARITGSFARDGYRVEKLIFESRPKFYVTADIYVPASGHAPYPAVLGVAGHSDASKAEPLYQRGWISLAKRGYIVLAFDPPGQGERSEYFDPELGRSRVGIGTPEHTNVGLQCILTGSSLAQYVVWDGIRAADYLLTRSDVDPKRLAVAGNSGGGMQSAYLAALEPRLAAAAPSCFLTSSAKLWTDLGPQDAEQNIIGSLAAGLDIKDFALAFAPRPFQFLTATRDFFPIAGAHEAFEEARGIYEIMGHPERVNFFEYDDTHGWSQPRREATYRWFQKWLNDQPLDQGAETQFDVEAEQTLWATPTGQLETSLKGETVHSLNAQLAERLAKQRPKLSGDALKLAISSRLGVPSNRKPHVPVVSFLGDESHAGYRMDKITLETEAGVRISARLFIPTPATTHMPSVLYVNPSGASPDADIEALTRTGQIVLAPALRGWEGPAPDRTSRPPHTALYRTSMRAMLVGRTLPGVAATDLFGAFDYLASLPQVDPARIGLFAKGNAVAIALYAAALEPGIRKVICEGGPVSYMEIVRQRFHGEIADLIVPGVLQSFDLPEVAAAILPRALWIVDPRMPSGAREAPEIAAAQYKLAASANFRLLERPAGWTLAKVYGPWLAR